MISTSSGRCTYDPGPVATTVGIRLKMAMLAVISTARRRVSHPRRIAEAGTGSHCDVGLHSE